jgi:transcriptional regulator with XRE-family HTH domain
LEHVRDKARIVQLAVNLAAARQSAGLSQVELAKRIGVAHSTISATESGKTELRATALIKWAAACNVSLANIAEGVE